MKNLIILAAFFYVAISSTSAQSFAVENWNRFEKIDEELTQTSIFNLAVSAPLSEKGNLTFEGFGLISNKGFSVVYVGLGSKIHENISISGSMGFTNQGDNSLTLAGSVLFTKGRVGWITIYENSPGNKYYFYTSHLMIKTSKNLKVGVMGRRFLGFGPRVELKVADNLMVWGSLNHDIEADKMKAAFAVKVMF